jgi:hypothetical protein
MNSNMLLVEEDEDRNDDDDDEEEEEEDEDSKGAERIAAGAAEAALKDSFKAPDVAVEQKSRQVNIDFFTGGGDSDDDD